MVNKTRKIYLFHRYILYGENQNNKIVDHANRNRFDNRRYNLREVTDQENHRNRGISINNKTGIIGVSWSESRNKYLVTICYENKSIFIGRFSSFEDATYARLLAEYKYFGTEFAPQRHLFEQYGIL